MPSPFRRFIICPRAEKRLLLLLRYFAAFFSFFALAENRWKAVGKKEHEAANSLGAKLDYSLRITTPWTPSTTSSSLYTSSFPSSRFSFSSPSFILIQKRQMNQIRL